MKNKKENNIEYLLLALCLVIFIMYIAIGFLIFDSNKLNKEIDNHKITIIELNKTNSELKSLTSTCFDKLGGCLNEYKSFLIETIEFNNELDKIYG